MPETRRLLNSYAAYLKDKYGATVYRVAVDAGFSCPNRGPDRRAPGCLYCDEHGARAPYLEGAEAAPAAAAEAGSRGDWRRGLRLQVEGTLQFLRRRYGAELFLLYFQAFSNTYAPLPRLAEIYDFALSLAPFRELLVSTRPDCVQRGVAALLASYRRRDREVWVELGLQSASDRTLRRVNRGHTVQQFEAAYRALKDRGLKVAVHLIFGLPGEGLSEILSTVRYLAALRPDGVKIHNLHVPKGSPLFQEYLAGELAVPCDRRHLLYTVRALELLPPSTLLMRLTCDTPAERLAAPRHFLPKASFYELLRQELRARGSWQGKAFLPPAGGQPDRAEAVS
jgi:radical SAM protein (TIGR01212 family)